MYINCYKIKMFYNLLVFIVIQRISLIFGQDYLPDVPCPYIFTYVYDEEGWSGRIILPTPDVNNVVLITNFSVPETNIHNIGTLHLNNVDAIDDIRNKRPFQYTYTLAESNFFPQLTGITYNGNILCIGPEINDPPFTNFFLTHTFKWFSPDIVLLSKPGNATERPIYVHEQSTIWPSIDNEIYEPSATLSQNNSYANDQSCGLIEHKSKREVYDPDPDVVQFIYNGTVIARNEHPWLAAIYDTDNGPLTFFCGGNLISNKHVLTAAHCTMNKRNIQVKVGAHNTKDLFETGAVIRLAKKIISHKEFKQGNGHADISMIVLLEEVGLNEFVRPICLWNRENDINTIIGDKGTIMGWGLTENGDPSSIPLQTDVKIVSQQLCQSVAVLKNAISNMTFCAGTKGAGPCMGDSGGGLFLRKNKRWYIRGIISISIGNRRLNVCDVNTYAVYADAAKYMDWIIETMK